MNTPIPDYLNEILDHVHGEDGGEVADYIPELKNADPDKLALAICTTSGHQYSVGDDEVEFSIQSISKPFVYALALEELGPERVGEVVGVEPSGEAFNEISLEEESKRPDNPMINAGAIAVNQLINGEDSSVEARMERIEKLFCDLAGRELRRDKVLTESELEGADRNLSIAYMLRSYGIVEDAADDVILSYTGQCSVMVTVRDLAVMAATLANGGVQPITGKRVLGAKAARQALAVMSSAGMYDAAGRWMTTVGIPAKSGVSGGLIGTMPGQLGIATFSPRLDEQGNSVRGVKAFQRLSDEMGLHLMSANFYTAPGIRSIDREGDSTIISLQGLINFPVAETVLHELSEHYLTSDRLVLDTTHVTGFNRIGRRVVKEGLRRFREMGLSVAIYDPDDMMTDLEFSDGTHAEEVEDFTTTFTASASPHEVMAAIARPAEWWIDSIEGEAAEKGNVFEVSIPGHYSQFRVTERDDDHVVWHVDETGHEDEFDEWNDTDLTFELAKKGNGTKVTFTHRGLQAHLDCFDDSVAGWKERFKQGLVPLAEGGDAKPEKARS